MNQEQGTYSPEHYNAVFEAMKKEFGTDWFNKVYWPMWGGIWRKQIKEWLFNENILITEIIEALPEAAGKLRWPAGRSFFKRVQDVCLKNRYERRRAVSVKEDRGLQSIGSMFPTQ